MYGLTRSNAKAIAGVRYLKVATYDQARVPPRAVCVHLAGRNLADNVATNFRVSWMKPSVLPKRLQPVTLRGWSLFPAPWCTAMVSRHPGGKKVEEEPTEVTEVPPPPISRELKKRWSHFIRKVYETDPLVCASVQVSTSSRRFSSREGTKYTGRNSVAH